MLPAVHQATTRDHAAWNNWVDNCPDAEPYHLFEWRAVLEEVFGNRCYYLMAEQDDGSIAGVLPLCHLDSSLFGNFLVSLPCVNYAGLLSESPDASTALLNAASELANKLGASHVELRHRSGSLAGLPTREDKVSMQLQLPDSADAMWSAFRPKLRAQIRRPEKDGAHCVEGGCDLLDDFYEVFSRNMRDLGTPVYPKAWFAAILTAFPDVSRLFVVYMDRMPVASGFTLGFRNTLEIPSASSLREFNRSAPNMLLYWSIIRHAMERGYTLFDFGRTTRQSGPWHFKRQWGATESQLHWNYLVAPGHEIPKLNPDNPKFSLAIKIWQNLPLPVANWLGPRIVRHLP